MADLQPVPRPNRVVLNFDQLAATRGVKPADLLPHPGQRLPPETIRTVFPNGYSISEGYLDALKLGACPLIVEDERPVLLMPPEDGRRQVAVYRWHLAQDLLRHPFAPAGPVGGWAAAALPWPIPEGLIGTRGLPGPGEGPERLIFAYKVLRAERAAGNGLQQLATRLQSAQSAVDRLSLLIQDSGQHHAGELWPQTRQELEAEKGPLASSYAIYRADYESACRAPSESQKNLAVFWSWCVAGVPTGQYWVGWNGSISAMDGPFAGERLPPPFVVLWSPGWPLQASVLAAVASAAYLIQIPEYTPVLLPSDLSIMKLRKQRRWLVACSEAAMAVFDSGINGVVDRYTNAAAQKSRDVLKVWLIQQGRVLGIGPTALAELIIDHRAESDPVLRHDSKKLARNLKNAEQDWNFRFNKPAPLVV